MEPAIQQLVSMGFAADLAVEALDATAGDILKATDWILNRHSRPIGEAQSNSTSPVVQPKINRFFNFNSKIDHNPQIDEIERSDSPIHTNKRKKSAEDNIAIAPQQPLAERMRPRVLDEVVGQEHLLGSESLLRSAISSGLLPSIILWGPPGTGKTSIARAITNSTASSSHRFVSLSAVTCGVKDVRDAVDDARKSKVKSNKRTVVFLDEVHRFNKAQQDSFLPVIEDGSIVFIGATTENPSFHLITPLLSRCRLLTLNPLKPCHIHSLLNRSVSDEDRGLTAGFNLNKPVKFIVEDAAAEFLALHCEGDARVALNALETAASICIKDLNRNTVISINLEKVKEAMQQKHLAYDRAGEEHYNLISALHKSMRGDNADAAIYWLARMLEGGEDPLYVARRLVRFASEDIGLADPQALVQAVACYQACHFIGMPECNVVLAQCVAYLAMAPKSIAVYRAIGSATKAVRESVGQNEGVPLHLRNAPTKMMKDVGYGKGYVYPPDDPAGAATQKYMPPTLEGYKFLHWP